MQGDRITLAHGDGGRATHQLIHELFQPLLRNPGLERAEDSTVLPWPEAGGRVAVTTDTFVVHPIFFPGGDLGRLAVCGTVNDLAVAGAKPLWLTAGFVLEEGYPLADLRRLVASMAEAARQAGVWVVAGDTKVVGRGQVDGCFINTAGVGLVPPGREMGAQAIRPGHVILISGGIAEHGVAVLSARAGLSFETPVVSDVAPLNGLATAVLDAAPGIACMRDPTRGGLATALADLAAASGCDMVVEEEAIPIQPAVMGACEMLGVDPLYLACEGRALVFCPEEEAEAALAAMRARPEGAGARIIGRVTGPGGRAFLRTLAGGTRRLEMLEGENLPRIC
ncbi:MAG TPA: hydrogenase expression/formation protein HypE [Symbiobacteriaceae bacterium]